MATHIVRLWKKNLNSFLVLHALNKILTYSSLNPLISKVICMVELNFNFLFLYCGACFVIVHFGSVAH